MIFLSIVREKEKKGSRPPRVGNIHISYFFSGRLICLLVGVSTR